MTVTRFLIDCLNDFVAAVVSICVAVASICASAVFLFAGVIGAGATYYAYSIASDPDARGLVERQEPTHLSLAIANAQDIRDALAAPIPQPPPLPPVTAELAYGKFLKSGLTVFARHHRPGARPLTIATAARDALAMNLETADENPAAARPPLRFSYSAFDRHRVY